MKTNFTPQYTHRVILHFRSICSSHLSFQQHLLSAQRVYSQYGIEICFGSGQSLALSEEEAEKYSVVDGECDWEITEGEISEIQKLGKPAASSGIFVYYVEKFKTGDLGCGGHAKDKPACLVSTNASKWDTAHEVGHVLLTSKFEPVHSRDIKNLMHADAAKYHKTPILTDSQISQIKRSPYCMKYL